MPHAKGGRMEAEMKKRLITILVTSLFMIAATGAFLWKINDMSNKLEEKDAQITNEEKDLVSTQDSKAADAVNDYDVIPLYLSGDRKNVVTTRHPSKKDIYNVKNSLKAEETLTDVKGRAGVYEPDTALWAYNPYGTNNSSLYVYFNTNISCYCRCTISVKDAKIPDFTRTLQSQAENGVTKEHEYQVTGLVQGKTNFIILNFYNSSDELVNTVTYKIDMPKSGMGSQTIIKNGNEHGKNKISNGLYVVFSDGVSKKVKTTRIVTNRTIRNGRTVTRRVKKNGYKKIKNYAILLYDNSGVLRGEIPLDGYCGRNIQMLYNGIAYACADNKIALVNPLGQVTKVYKINGYKQSGEFAYDGFGNFYAIATPNKKKSVKKSCIIKLELESGKTSMALDMNILLSTVYKQAVKNGGRENPDWIDLNSVQVTGTNQLLVSSQALSSIFKVNNVNSLMPKVDYIISDKSIWNGFKGLKKKVLTKTQEESEATEAPDTQEIVSILEDTSKPSGPFASQAGQNAVLYEKPSSLGEGQYYLSMLNNNSGLKALDNNKSYYYRYLVDEAARTYMRTDTISFAKTDDEGNIAKSDDVFVYCNAGKNKFMEADSKGKLIKEFTIDRNLYRVYKYDWKEFWFV